MTAPLTNADIDDILADPIIAKMHEDFLEHGDRERWHEQVQEYLRVRDPQLSRRLERLRQNGVQL